eukprot:4494585-Prymnesium_polylepis.1
MVTVFKGIAAHPFCVCQYVCSSVSSARAAVTCTIPSTVVRSVLNSAVSLFLHIFMATKISKEQSLGYGLRITCN